MDIIFKKNDFKLCYVPVPDGYKQSQTHSGVAIHEGYYYLTTTPYPNYSLPRWQVYLKAAFNKLTFKKIVKPFVAEQFENPCLYIGVPRKDVPPYSFKLLLSSPLMPPPDPYYGLPAFNSDPDIFLEEDIIHVLGRQTYRTEICPNQPLNKYKNRLYRIYGKIDKNRFYYLGTDFILETDRLLVSPCMTKYNGQYIMTELESNVYNDGQRFDGLYITYSDRIDNIGKNANWLSINVDGGDYLPWHMSLFNYKSKLYAIIACVKKGIGHRCWQMLGEFNDDLSELKIYQTPLTDYASYRGAACVTESGEFVLYNTTVHEKIKGSNSVDGRDVIMAHIPFDKLLSILRVEE